MLVCFFPLSYMIYGSLLIKENWRIHVIGACVCVKQLSTITRTRPLASKITGDNLYFTTNSILG